jgi:hypothetical protein
MQVHVRVPFIRTEAEDVESLGGDGAPESLADAMHDPLELHVLIFSEVARHVLSMLLRRDDDVSADRRVAIEERNRSLILIDEVMRNSTDDKLTDEARSLASPPVVRSDIDECHVRRK